MTTIAHDTPQAVAQLDDESRLNLYRTMVLARTFEEVILREYHADKGPGFDIGKGLVPGEMHLAAGQEPVAAGVCAHLTTEDAVTATHRPHHFAVAHGVDLDTMAAEIFGREGGLGHGRGGHMHLFDPDDPLLLLGHHRGGLPAGARSGVCLPQQGHGPGRGGRHRRGRGQPGRLPRVAQPRRAVEAPGRLRGRGQRLGHLRAPLRVDVGPVQRQPRRGLRHARPNASRTTTSRQCGPLPGAPWRGPAPARGRRSSRCTRCACGGTSRGTPRPTGRSWPRCLPATRSPRTRAGCARPACSTTRLVARIKQEAQDRVELAVTHAKESPVPDPSHATAYVFC